MDLAANLDSIQQRIAAACARSERSAEAVRLVAVTKNHPPETVRAAVGLGQTLFGENRVQEACAKIPLCPGAACWHFIGHLQTNKCRDVVRGFEMVESVDSLHLAQELDKACEKAARTLPILLEVNVAGEASKFGYRPEALLAEFKQLNALSRLEIHGLMTVAPWSPVPERVRPIFRRLRELREACEQILGAPLPELSMGMSGDFEAAVEEGATLVRIGTALFGPRAAANKAAKEVAADETAG